MKGFVIAGTGSGSGKTTLCLGTLAYLSGLGYQVAPFKVGPDFIDPGHHTALTGKISRNLDSWMLSKSTNEQIFAKGCTGADIAVVEGVMGLFDGYSGTSESGSTAQMAKWLGLPVILVVDARSMARSAAAIVQGFENFDPEIEFAGVIFSKTGSSRHYAYLKEAVEKSCRMKCLGHMPRNQNIVMPERHLGLVTSGEHTISSGVLAQLVDMLDKNTDIEELVKSLPCRIETGSASEAGKNIETQISEHKKNEIEDRSEGRGEKNIRVAVARDKAFCFYYQENIEALQRHGAQIVEFSPIESPALPPEIHGIYFGGGYPELFANDLSLNRSLMDQIKQKSLQGMPIYGECGGFMYLCSDITGMDEKKRYSMTGCFPFSAVMSKKMRSLGYRQVSLIQDTIIGKSGDVLRGHEFHYSSLENDAPFQIQTKAGMSELKKIYETSGRDGQEISLDGYQVNNTLGSYLHVHFDSMAGCAAQAFVNVCREFSSFI